MQHVKISTREGINTHIFYPLLHKSNYIVESLPRERCSERNKFRYSRTKTPKALNLRNMHSDLEQIETFKKWRRNNHKRHPVASENAFLRLKSSKKSNLVSKKFGKLKNSEKELQRVEKFKEGSLEASKRNFARLYKGESEKLIFWSDRYFGKTSHFDENLEREERGTLCYFLALLVFPVNGPRYETVTYKLASVTVEHFLLQKAPTNKNPRGYL